MAPRAYRLQRRAETANATRDRIVEAALQLYRERGVTATSLQAVADKADVSRGTILHHFGNSDRLIEAAARQILVSLELPDIGVLDGLDDDEARVRAFVSAMVRFFERSMPWWQVFQDEMERPGLREQEAKYWAALAELQDAAIGQLADDRVANATVSAIIHPATLGDLMWQLQAG